MRELGERLRHAREEKGISLEQIKNSTKIRLCYLQALENGELHMIPGEVYIRGFLQNFASCVGLDPGEVLEQYDQLRAAKEIPPPKAVAAEDDGEPEPRSRFAWWQPAMVGVGIVLLAFLIYLGRNDDLHPKPAVKRRAKAVTTAVNTPKPPEPAVKQRAKAVEPAVNVPKPLTEETEEGVHLVLNYTARCWVSVVVDGDTVFEDIVPAGEVQDWKAKSTISCRFGNAGGVQATLNGKALGAMGLTGENATKEFTVPEAP